MSNLPSPVVQSQRLTRLRMKYDRPRVTLGMREPWRGGGGGAVVRTENLLPTSLTSQQGNHVCTNSRPKRLDGVHWLHTSVNGASTSVISNILFKQESKMRVFSMKVLNMMWTPKQFFLLYLSLFQENSAHMNKEMYYIIH